MTECPSLKGCPFFNNMMAAMPSRSIMIKKKYCLGEYVRCARYVVAGRLGKENVPIDLYPDDFSRAGVLLGDTGKK